MAEADVNAAMYVQFEADSNIVSAARIAVGGILSSVATAYDLTQLLYGRFVANFVAMLFCCHLILNMFVAITQANLIAPVPGNGTSDEG